MESWSAEEVCCFIAEKGFEKDVIELFRVNRIRGPVLSLLTDAELKELGVAALGDRKLLLKLFQHTSSSKASSSTNDSNEKVYYTPFYSSRQYLGSEGGKLSFLSCPD